MAEDQNRREADVLDEVRILRERIDKECTNSVGWTVVSLLESLKVLEKQEFDIQSQHNSDCSRLQQEIEELDKMLHSGSGYEDSDTFHRSLQDSNERLESAKKELAAKLRSIMSVKWQLDEVPVQAELMQYKLRFSELNTQIQKKHRQTRKHYDTYNALLEIRELMLKETSLLNSINLQVKLVEFVSMFVCFTITILCFYHDSMLDLVTIGDFRIVEIACEHYVF
ncbi:hypothetical protein ACS0TY_012320 [Phlomoides rotata]